MRTVSYKILLSVVWTALTLPMALAYQPGSTFDKGNPPPAQRERFDYRVMTVPHNLPAADLQNRLKSYSNQGCQMSSAFEPVYGNRGTVVNNRAVFVCPRQ